MATYADPFRLRLLKGVTGVLHTITPANGYANDLSQDRAVARGRIVFGEDDPLPMVAILEPPVPLPFKVPPDYSTTGYYPYQLVIQGFVEDDFAHPLDPALILLADVKRAIGLEFKKLQRHEPVAFGMPTRRFGKAWMDFGTCRPSDDLSSKAFFWLVLNIEVAEDYLNAYED